MRSVVVVATPSPAVGTAPSGRPLLDGPATRLVGHDAGWTFNAQGPAGPLRNGHALRIQPWRGPVIPG